MLVILIRNEQRILFCRPTRPVPFLIAVKRFSLFSKTSGLLKIAVKINWNLSRYFSALRNVSKKMCCKRHFLRSRSVMRCFCSGLTRSSIKQSKSRNGKGSTPNVRKRVSYEKASCQSSNILRTCSA